VLDKPSRLLASTDHRVQAFNEDDNWSVVFVGSGGRYIKIGEISGAAPPDLDTYGGIENHFVTAVVGNPEFAFSLLAEAPDGPIAVRKGLLSTTTLDGAFDAAAGNLTGREELKSAWQAALATLPPAERETLFASIAQLGTDGKLPLSAYARVGESTAAAHPTLRGAIWKQASSLSLTKVEDRANLVALLQGDSFGAQPEARALACRSIQQNPKGLDPHIAIAVLSALTRDPKSCPDLTETWVENLPFERRPGDSTEEADVFATAELSAAHKKYYDEILSTNLPLTAAPDAKVPTAQTLAAAPRVFAYYMAEKLHLERSKFSLDKLTWRREGANAEPCLSDKVKAGALCACDTAFSAWAEPLLAAPPTARRVEVAAQQCAIQLDSVARTLKFTKLRAAAVLKK
jgi:hypothetical protein